MDVPPHRIPRRAFSRIYDLRPRLAVLAALLDDWASRPLHHYLPKWNFDDDDDDAIFPRRPPFELRRSHSARKPDDGLYWMFDDELLMAGRCGWSGCNGLRRSHTHSGRRPKNVDELRSLRRQYFEGRDDQDDGEVHFYLPTKNERQLPVQMQTHRSRVDDNIRTSTDRLQIDRSPMRSRVDRSSPFERERPEIRSQVERPAVQIDAAREQSKSESRTSQESSISLLSAERSREVMQPTSRNIRIEREVPGDDSKEVTQSISRNIRIEREVPGDGSKEVTQQASRNIRIEREVPGESSKEVTQQASRNIRIEREVPGESSKEVTQPVSRNIRIDLHNQTTTSDLSSNKDADAVADGTLVPLSLLEGERRTIRELREENIRLKAVISNLQDVNKRWQSFNGDRQTYIQRLLNTIEEQQAQLNACLDALQAPPTRPAAPAPLRQEEADEVNRMARLRSLQREVAELQCRLEEAKREHRETVTLLQMQVETHKDDWEAERREKQAAEARLRELSRKMGSDDNISVQKQEINENNLSCKCTESKDNKMHSFRRSVTPTNNLSEAEIADDSRRCYADDIVTDGGAEEADPWPADRDRTESQYAFSGEALSSLCGQSGSRGPCFQRQTESPSLSDALTPTPTPTPHQQPNSSYPVELSGSASSLASCALPHVSIPSSSRASTPDPDMSMCSDVTLDCSPPSPIQGTLTVGFNSSGLASVTSFRMRPVPLSADIEELEEDEAPAGERRGERNFWEAGAPTNTREDVICPSCGDVFPPLRHLQFLDHFEVCANPSLSRPRR